MIGNILKFIGSWLYGPVGSSGITEIGIESCRKARAQLYDGYTIDETSKYFFKNDFNFKLRI